MTILLLVLGIFVVPLLSGLLGYYADTHNLWPAPAYWALGYISGAISIILIHTAFWEFMK